MIHEGWREVKIYYMHSKKDNFIRPKVQLRIIHIVKERGADVEIVEIDAGHVPMVGLEWEVFELLVKAGGFQ